MAAHVIGSLVSLRHRPPNAFMWKGDQQPFYNRWWLKVNAPDGDTFSIQVVINNPWDEDGLHRYTGASIFFDRFSVHADKNLMSMPSFPLSSFSAATDRFEVCVGDSLFTDRTFRGKIRDDHHNKDISSIFNPTEYLFGKGRIRIDTRKRFRCVRVVYESHIAREDVRHMDWHSPDDTVLESGMSLTAPARMEIYTRAFLTCILFLLPQVYAAFCR